jgi:hypothetical protein
LLACAATPFFFGSPKNMAKKLGGKRLLAFYSYFIIIKLRIKARVKLIIKKG